LQSKKSGIFQGNKIIEQADLKFVLLTSLMLQLIRIIGNLCHLKLTKIETQRFLPGPPVNVPPGKTCTESGETTSVHGKQTLIY